MLTIQILQNFMTNAQRAPRACACKVIAENACVLSLTIGLLLATNALAQSDLPLSGEPSRPMLGGTNGLHIPAETRTFGSSGNTDILRHRDATGKPCVSIGGFSRPHIINEHLYDHVIVGVNTCAQRIKVQVCYYNSTSCVPLEVPGGERREVILGTQPAEKDFRFEFREKFN
jgi:hypothetical protein